MILYHLEKAKYRDVWPPEGTLFGHGRWNKPGQWVIYCSPSIALAKLEILANSTTLPNNMICMQIEVAGQVNIMEVNEEDLPKNWSLKPYPKSLTEVTKSFIQTDNLLLKVPSAQSHRESNFLINVRHQNFHTDAKLIEVFEEPFDSRLKN